MWLMMMEDTPAPTENKRMSETKTELEHFTKRANYAQEISFPWPFVVEEGEIRALKDDETATLFVDCSRIPEQQVTDSRLRASIKAPAGSDGNQSYFVHYLSEHLEHAIKSDDVKAAVKEMNQSERTLLVIAYLNSVNAEDKKAEKNGDT